MNKFSQILEELEVFELAYLIKHRLKEFMPETRNRIIFEMLKKGYEKHDVDKLLEEKKKEPKSVDSSYLFCKNCGSSKFYTIEKSKKNDYFTKFEQAEITKKTKYICWICNTKGQVVATKEATFWDRLMGRHKSYKKRIK